MKCELDSIRFCIAYIIYARVCVCISMSKTRQQFWGSMVFTFAKYKSKSVYPNCTGIIRLHGNADKNTAIF